MDTASVKRVVELVVGTFARDQPGAPSAERLAVRVYLYRETFGCTPHDICRTFGLTRDQYRAARRRGRDLIDYAIRIRRLDWERLQGMMFRSLKGDEFW